MFCETRARLGGIHCKIVHFVDFFVENVPFFREINNFPSLMIARTVHLVHYRLVAFGSNANIQSMLVYHISFISIRKRLDCILDSQVVSFQDGGRIARFGRFHPEFLLSRNDIGKLPGS